MLNTDVRTAVREGRFFVYPVRHINEAIALMTGMDPGEPDEDGVFSEGSFNRRVADRLEEFAEVGRKKDDGGDNGDNGNGAKDDDQ